MIGAGKRILVVDDNLEARQVLKQILRACNVGYQFCEVVNGEEALAAVSHEPPDLMLLDLVMPVMDGFGVLEALGRSEHPYFPIVVISVMGDRDFRLRALQMGATDFLNKPVDPEEVCIRVRAMLELKAEHDAARIRSDQLERKVLDRTAELQFVNDQLHKANLQLQRSCQELADADRHKVEFLSVITHELRTPLNFILGFASLLDDEVAGPLSVQQHEFLSKILYGHDRMLLLISNLIDASQMAARRFYVTPVPADYEKLVREACAALRPSALERQVTLDCTVEVRDPVHVDVWHVSQAISNLVDNGIKFTPESGTVTVRAYLRDGQLVTEVRDTGIGIKAEELPRLFKSFSQLDMSNTRKYGGTGLGLFVARSIVEAHGGQMGVMSEPGQGSTFWFTLPSARTGRAPEAKEHPQESRG